MNRVPFSHFAPVGIRFPELLPGGAAQLVEGVVGEFDHMEQG
jgi:hypothetical protein